MGQEDIVSFKCPKHDLEVIGTACDEVYCIECSNEDQEELKLLGPNRLDKNVKITTEEYHGKIVWQFEKMD